MRCRSCRCRHRSRVCLPGSGDDGPHRAGAGRRAVAIPHLDRDLKSSPGTIHPGARAWNWFRRGFRDRVGTAVQWGTALLSAPDVQPGDDAARGSAVGPRILSGAVPPHRRRPFLAPATLAATDPSRRVRIRDRHDRARRGESSEPESPTNRGGFSAGAPSPRPVVPAGFYLPLKCRLVGVPVIASDGTTWRFDCGAENANAAAALAPALKEQGWTFCGDLAGRSAWGEGAMTIFIEEGAAGGLPTLRQIPERAAPCP